MKKNWLVIVLLAVSQFVMVLDSTVMNVSITQVASDLDTTITGMQAAITFYTLTMAAFMLTGGKLGDKWGRSRALKIGAVIYGLGSLITAISPNLTVLLFGWSLVEGLGAVLVIPAIAALAAINYTGKARVAAFSILGAATGLAAAAGPLIGGLVTTYSSWRYVFVAETIVMIVVLVFSGRIKDVAANPNVKIDILSVVLSAGGMAMLVFGVLQSKTWGWFVPLNPPQINGVEFAPLGISPVTYLIILGIVVLWWFVQRQRSLIAAGRMPLLKVSLFRIGALRSGLSGFLVQYFAIAALFFVIPVYLQTMLGQNALETGLKILPLSAGLVVFSALGSWATSRRSAKRIAQIGQITMAVGLLFVLVAIQPELQGWPFAIGMFIIGGGFGLLASQLGNVNMSAVDKDDTSEVGGLQGTFQNLGSSFGTAIVGSMFILLLASGFTTAVQNNATITPEERQAVSAYIEGGVPIISQQQAEDLIVAAGGSEESAAAVAQEYADSQIVALKQALFIVLALLVLSLLLSRHLPAEIVANEEEPVDEAVTT
ncbi:Predicted arabinose efflux permease, MFS family [Agromyces sp. CF514]|uniref:MFS transporter n=1 Tax=Agromyces sp. CF514 TaxID=1881031 RepID=UPI0008F24F9E|nr:MFS transporter [Agromyces sp. CF514]SFR78359.1 Predicted arabinose efflux permease, MFS family [Agromyces sp. CF514]